MKTNRKKLLGLAGLLAVGAMTVFAAALPASNTYAVSDVIINIEVTTPPDEYALDVTAPHNDEKFVRDTGTLRGSYANASSVAIVMTSPSGANTTIFNSVNPSSALDIPYTLDSGYGDYTFTVYSKGLNGQDEPTETITVHYHSAFDDIVNPGSPENPVTEDPKANITFGPEVCGIGFQLYPATSTPPPPTYDISSPLLVNPDGTEGYTILGSEFQSLPGFSSGTVEVTIPLSSKYPSIKPGMYKILLTTYDCSGDNNIVEEGLDVNGGYDNGFYIFGDINVPNTGLIKIGSFVVAEKDLVITGVIAFALSIGAYLLIRTRRRIR